MLVPDSFFSYFVNVEQAYASQRDFMVKSELVATTLRSYGAITDKVSCERFQTIVIHNVRLGLALLRKRDKKALWRIQKFGVKKEGCD